MAVGKLATLIVLLGNYCLILAEWNTGDYLKRDHSLVKPYTDGRWDFMGSTMVTNNYVRLTPDHQSKQGSIWSNQPCNIHDWELHVHFKVHGLGKDLFGDGMTIWYTKDRMIPGPVFGNKDFFKGLAIFLDTYSNHNGPHNHGHPYISAMVNNGSLHYDHDRDGTHTSLDGCEAQFRNSKFETFVAIRYEKNHLTVSIDIDDQNTWKQCFAVSGVMLPTGYYFGASAATGQLADNHDILSMKLYDISTADSGDEDTEDYSKVEPGADFLTPPRDHVEDTKGNFMLSSLTGWKLLVLIILIIVGLGVCLLVGFIVFTKRQEDARKRFY